MIRPCRRKDLLPSSKVIEDRLTRHRAGWEDWGIAAINDWLGSCGIRFWVGLYRWQSPHCHFANPGEASPFDSLMRTTQRWPFLSTRQPRTTNFITQLRTWITNTYNDLLRDQTIKFIQIRKKLWMPSVRTGNAGTHTQGIDERITVPKKYLGKDSINKSRH